MTDGYLCSLLTTRNDLDAVDIPQALIDLKRQQIIAKRQLRDRSKHD
jgi:hypothetical protein